jgi:hypothetical protein
MLLRIALKSLPIKTTLSGLQRRVLTIFSTADSLSKNSITVISVTFHSVKTLCFFIKHIKRFNPQADLEHLLLSGSHCQGSCKKNEDGQYPIVPITLDWMRRKELIK